MLTKAVSRDLEVGALVAAVMEATGSVSGGADGLVGVEDEVDYRWSRVWCLPLHVLQENRPGQARYPCADEKQFIQSLCFFTSSVRASTLRFRKLSHLTSPCCWPQAWQLRRVFLLGIVW